MFRLLTTYEYESTGKTNHGRQIYGRATRHKHVALCSVGALAFYLALRFHISKEFLNLPNDYFLENRNWFSIKLLTNAYGSAASFKRQIQGDTYSQNIRSVLLDLGLPTHKLKHLGRGMGAKELEYHEVDAETIRQIGNWNPSVQDVSYSAKLPLRGIRNMAGFYKGGGLYCNPRTSLKVDEELLSKSPLGKPFKDALGVVEEQVIRSSRSKNESPRITALQFLRFMGALNEVLFQDAAAMLVEQPSRRDHPLFRLPCFSCPEFEVRTMML